MLGSESRLRRGHLQECPVRLVWGGRWSSGWQGSSHFVSLTGAGSRSGPLLPSDRSREGAWRSHPAGLVCLLLATWSGGGAAGGPGIPAPLPSCLPAFQASSQCPRYTFPWSMPRGMPSSPHFTKPSHCSQEMRSQGCQLWGPQGESVYPRLQATAHTPPTQLTWKVEAEVGGCLSPSLRTQQPVVLLSSFTNGGQFWKEPARTPDWPQPGMPVCVGVGGPSREPA